MNRIGNITTDKRFGYAIYLPSGEVFSLRRKEMANTRFLKTLASSPNYLLIRSYTPLSITEIEQRYVAWLTKMKASARGGCTRPTQSTAPTDGIEEVLRHMITPKADIDDILHQIGKARPKPEPKNGAPDETENIAKQIKETLQNMGIEADVRTIPIQ